MLQNKIKDFQMQDLRCIKCKMNRGGLLTQYCPCAGKFIQTRDTAQFLDFLGTISEIARFHDFKYLQLLVQPLFFN